MLITNNMQKEKYENLVNKNTKLSRDSKNGKLIKIKNGLYETNPNVPPYYLANAIYGPSYISFDYALSYYGLIPEKVQVVTSATFNKKKTKYYKTPLGNFTYRDVPSNVYPFEINLIEENGYTFQIATKEKALCDKLYTLSPINNLKELEILLFKDLRIDRDEFNKLDKEMIEKLSKMYHSTNVYFLAKYVKDGKNE